MCSAFQIAPRQVLLGIVKAGTENILDNLFEFAFIKVFVVLKSQGIEKLRDLESDFVEQI
jgi:hypothetical protein